MIVSLFPLIYSELIRCLDYKFMAKVVLYKLKIMAGIVVAILRCIGFAITGPVAGSLAACVQKVCYGGAVLAGSVFACCQRTAMRNK